MIRTLHLLGGGIFVLVAIIYFVTGLSHQIHVDSLYYLGYSGDDTFLLDGELRSELLFVKLINLVGNPLIYPILISTLLGFSFVFVIRKIKRNVKKNVFFVLLLLLNPYVIHLSASVLKDVTLLLFCLLAAYFALNRKLIFFLCVAPFIILIRPAYAIVVVMLFCFGWKVNKLPLNAMLLILLATVVQDIGPLSINYDYTGSEYLKSIWFRIDGLGISKSLELIVSYFLIGILPTFILSQSISELFFGMSNFLIVLGTIFVFLKYGKRELGTVMLIDFLFFCLSPAPTAFLRYRMSLLVASSIFVLVRNQYIKVQKT